MHQILEKADPATFEIIKNSFTLFPYTTLFRSNRKSVV